MTPRYRLRTLLILLAVLPPVLAVGWSRYAAWKAEQERLKALQDGMSVQWMFGDVWTVEATVQPPQPQPKAPAKAGE